jgi:hypothetical protein
MAPLQYTNYEKLVAAFSARASVERKLEAQDGSRDVFTWEKPEVDSWY